MAHLQAKEQRSNDILAAWCQPLPSDLNLTANDLPQVLKTPLPRPIPSDDYPPQGDAPMKDVLLFPRKDTSVTIELAFIRHTIYLSEKHGDTENSVHSGVDNLILTPIKLLTKRMGCILQIKRNDVDASDATLRYLQPDVVVWLPSGVLAFKGEEKANETDLPVAKDELLEKIGILSDESYGRVPFQICYAVGGNLLQFIVINRASSSVQPMLMEISPLIDLSSVAGRSLCIRYIVNIARVLVWLQEKFPENGQAI